MYLNCDLADIVWKAARARAEEDEDEEAVINTILREEEQAKARDLQAERQERREMKGASNSAEEAEAMRLGTLVSVGGGGGQGENRSERRARCISQQLSRSHPPPKFHAYMEQLVLSGFQPPANALLPMTVQCLILALQSELQKELAVHPRLAVIPIPEVPMRNDEGRWRVIGTADIPIVLLSKQDDGSYTFVDVSLVVAGRTKNSCPVFLSNCVMFLLLSQVLVGDHKTSSCFRWDTPMEEVEAKRLSVLRQVCKSMVAWVAAQSLIGETVVLRLSSLSKCSWNGLTLSSSLVVSPCLS
jgi:hypothetical protein